MTRPHGIADRIAALSEAQRAVLSKRVLEARCESPRSAGGGGRLAAFVTTDCSALDGFDPSPAELRDYLGERLPGYMVPESIRLLEELPVLPNGKIDLSALRALRTESGHEERPFLEPRDPTERALAEIWRNVLQVDAVGVYDDFFELGGDSILSIQVVSMAHEAGLELAPNDVLNFPVLAELAARCSASPKTSDTADLAREESPDPASSRYPQGHHQEADEGAQASELTRPPLFIVHGLIGVAQRLREYAGPRQPFYVFNSHWHDAKVDPDVTVEQMAEEYLGELRSLQPKGPYHLCGFSMGGPVAFTMAQSLITSGERVDFLLLIDPPRLLEVHGATPRREPPDPVPAAPAAAPPVPIGLRQNLVRHCRALSELTLAEKANYVWVRVRFKLRYRVIPQGLVRHYRALASRTFAEKVRYVSARVHFKLRHRFLPWFEPRLSAACRKLKLPVPPAYREAYVRWVYHRAWAKYRPKSYGRDVLVFRAKDSPHAADMDSWAAVVNGKLDVELFDGRHKDLVAVRESIDQWAPRLIALLGQRQMASDERPGGK